MRMSVAAVDVSTDGTSCCFDALSVALRAAAPLGAAIQADDGGAVRRALSFYIAHNLRLPWTDVGEPGQRRLGECVAAIAGEQWEQEGAAQLPRAFPGDAGSGQAYVLALSMCSPVWVHVLDGEKTLESRSDARLAALHGHDLAIRAEAAAPGRPSIGPRRRCSGRPALRLCPASTCRDPPATRPAAS
jgi:hypothetical protein